MAENAVEVRREARRKRILENSENRLQKIFAYQSNINSVPSSASGNKEALAFVEGTKVSSSDHYTSGVSPVEHAVNGRTPKESSPATSFSADQNKLNDTEAGQDSLANHLLSNLQELLDNTSIPTSDDIASQETEIKPVSSTFQHYKRLYVIGLALIVRLTLAFNLGFVYGEVLLAPFLLTELSAMLLAENASTPCAISGILQLALLLGGIIPSRATIITKIFNETSTLLQNLCIYLFTLVLCHTFLDWPG